MPETRDIELKGLAIGAAIVGGGIAASVLAAWIVVRSSDAPAEGPNGARPPEIAGPRLQTAPQETLDAFLARKRVELRQAGPGRMPIEQAMRALSSRKDK
ncbi:MAG: hypothetical protein JO035_04250 [Betaproteobacteria bacterium]|nr:hypothetical protein [Betaproteobacteria bacterium]